MLLAQKYAARALLVRKTEIDTKSVGQYEASAFQIINDMFYYLS